MSELSSPLSPTIFTDASTAHQLVKVFEETAKRNFSRCELKETYPLSKTALLEWNDKMKKMALKAVEDTKLLVLQHQRGEVSYHTEEGLKDLVPFATEQKEYIINFAETLAMKIKHIPFDTFHDKCIQIAIEVCSKIQEFRKKHKDNVRSILVISGELNKSQFWVNILAYKAFIGKNLITHIVSDISNGIAIHNSTYPIIPTQIFYIDDCAYSGLQLLDSVDVFRKKVEIQDTCEVYAAVCYISSKAKKKFINRNIQILNSSEEIKSMRNYFQMYNMPIPKNKMAEKTGPFPYNLDRHMIYFDHKIADSVSVYIDCIKYGEYYNWVNDSDAVVLKPFIKKCETSVEIVKSTHAYGQSTAKQLFECPPTFYKMIHYEFPDIIRGRKSFDIRIIDLVVDRFD